MPNNIIETKEKEAEILIIKLMNYYKVFNASKLAIKLGVTQPTIAYWKIRNSVMAIRKKCIDLGIYSEIFTENTYDEVDHNGILEYDKILALAKLGGQEGLDLMMLRLKELKAELKDLI